MNLYKIEKMKIRMSTYLWAVLAVFAGLAALAVLCLFLGEVTPGEAELFTEWNGLLALSAAMDYACFSIFAAVLGAKVIVEEYCSRRAVLLCAYPVSRRSIFDTKCLILAGFTMGAACLCNLAVDGLLFVTAKLFGMTPAAGGGIGMVMIASVLAGVMAAAVGMISVVVGWRKRSVSAAILCSLIFVCLVPNLIASFCDQMVWVMLGLSLLFSAAANGVLRNMAKGIEQMEV